MRPELSTYVNARFCYAVCFPPAVLLPRGESADGDGQAFVSPDGKSKMVVWGSWNALAETVSSRYASERRHLLGCTVTRKKLEPTWFALSGFAPDSRLCYDKQILDRNRWLGLWIEYPSSKRARFGALIARISRSLRPTADCWW